MEKYENLGLVGEGSYGMVLKCRHKESGQLVAIKKFLESEDDKMVKKIAMREVRMLKQLRHDNLVNLLEVFRRKKRLYLVFEFVDHTVLDELEKCPNGLDEMTTRKILWQVVKGIEFCHVNSIIHRDIKPENILVSKNGVVKLCDFGFARTLAQPGEIYTDYVATRWYRAPELLVGDTKYGKAVDIWAVGCLTLEMLTGDPLFPGDSDIDQLHQIVKVFGNLTSRHKEVFLRNPLFVGMRLPEVREVTPLEKKFTRISHLSLSLMKDCLRLDPDDRPTTAQLLKHDFFLRDGFSQRIAHDIKVKVSKEQQNNPLINTHDKEDGEKDGADKSNVNKTTTKKKKKLIPLLKKESKADAEAKDGHSKADNAKVNVKDNREKYNSEDKVKHKLPDPPDKGSKKTPDHTIALPATHPKHKPQNKVASHGTDNHLDKPEKAQDKLHNKSDVSPRSQDKNEKIHNKSDNTHEKGEKTHSKSDRHDKHVNAIKNDVVEKDDKSDKKQEKSREEKTDREWEKEYEETNTERQSRVDHKPDRELDMLDLPKVEITKDKGDVIQDRDKDDKSIERDEMKDKENSTSIPPINPSGHSLHITPTIPSLNRVNDKMAKKPTNFKKSMPNHHSVLISPQPLQSEKSHLHDKSLEKLRTKNRDGSNMDVRGRDKEIITLPEVRGAEGSQTKLKPKAPTQRASLATIPHITNLDPFTSSSQVETNTEQKAMEKNLPSV